MRCVSFVAVATAMLVMLVARETLVGATFSQTIYTTTMNGLNALPFPLPTSASGAAVCSLDRNQETLECTIQTSGLEQVRTARLHHADDRSIGPIVYNFTRPSNHASFPTNFVELIQLVDYPEYPIFLQKLDFLNGLWYVEVSGIDAVNERIRGQLEQSDNYFALLNPEETFPPAWGSAAHGIVLATYSRFVPLRELAFDIVHDVQTPTRAQLRRGPRFEPGDFVYQTKTSASPVTESVQLTLNEDKALFEFGIFAQVYTNDYPQGEVRGQLMPVSVIPEVSFTSKLSSASVGADVNSQAQGCMLVVYDCDTNVLEYLIFHDAIQPTSAIFYVGKEGTDQALGAFRADGHTSPIFGRRVLDDTEEYYLLSQEMFVVISTVKYPKGEIRGQITSRREFFAYFSGPQMVPAVTTSSLGCGTFTLDQETLFDYDILHNVKFATALELHVGSVGETGVREKVFRSPTSPVNGDEITITDEFKKQLYLGRLYLTIKSEEYPDGVIRGQLLRIKPCNAVQQDIPHTLTFPLILTLGSSASTVLPSLIVAIVSMCLFWF